MTIRQATTKDLKSINRLIAHYPRQLLQYPLPKSKEFFVAEEHGQIIGCCALEVYSKRLAEIRSLAVKKEYQKKGIGSKLVAKCVKKAEKLGIHEVLSITGAAGLFSKQGFRVFNKEKFALFKVLD